jgi:hypothetical protein
MQVITLYCYLFFRGCGAAGHHLKDRPLHGRPHVELVIAALQQTTGTGIHKSVKPSSPKKAIKR